MAAAIIPLIAGIAPSVIQLISALVHKFAPQAEQKYGAGTGPIKFADVFNNVIIALQQAAASGAIDKTLPPDELIKAIIEAVVNSLNINGQLSTPVTAAPPATDTTSGTGSVSVGQTIPGMGKIIAILVQQ